MLDIPVFKRAESIRVSKNIRLLGSLTSPYVRKVRIVMAGEAHRLSARTRGRLGARHPHPRVQSARQGPVPDHGRRRRRVRLARDRRVPRWHDTLAKLIPPSGRERAEVRTWEALADGVVDALDPGRGSSRRSGRPSSRARSGSTGRCSKMHAGIAAMSHGLGEKPWCNGHAYSLADIAVGCALGLPRLPLRLASTGAGSIRTLRA